MSEAYIGEIRAVGFNFAPKGWAQCNGQLLPITQNQALFSLLSTTYGGDGRTTFGLPNLQGRSPLGAGQGTGLSPNAPGASGGAAAITLTTDQIPAHTHAVQANSAAGTTLSPGGNLLAASGESANLYAAPPSGTGVPLASGTISNAGGSQPHNNLPPYQTLNYIICLSGLYPSRP